jgi:type I restriction enzyme, S subunit
MAVDKIDLNNLDKSDWKTYRFDEIAQNISERVDPNNTDLEVYVGLEHIDSESLHIKRFGTPDDVNGTKLKFYKGDIIFGRRRAYQRKAGIATCDGFCSAHSLVLRANPEVIDPGLFPFFLHSDLFMNRAVDISVGSLSPTINWGKLKEQEFILPPKNIQSEIASIMLLSEEVLSKYFKTLATSKALSESLLKNIFFNQKEGVSLENLFEISTGFPYKSKEFNEKQIGYKLMRGINIKEGGFLWNEKIDRHYDGDGGLDEKFRVKNLDILVPMDGSKLGYNYAQATKKEQGYFLVQRIASFRCEDVSLRNLFLAFLSSRYFRDYVAKNNTTTAIPHVSLKQLKAIKLPRLDDYISDNLEAYDEIKEMISILNVTIKSKNQLKKSLINQVF